MSCQAFPQHTFRPTGIRLPGTNSQPPFSFSSDKHTRAFSDVHFQKQVPDTTRRDRNECPAPCAQWHEAVTSWRHIMASASVDNSRDAWFRATRLSIDLRMLRYEGMICPGGINKQVCRRAHQHRLQRWMRQTNPNPMMCALADGVVPKCLEFSDTPGSKQGV